MLALYEKTIYWNEKNGFCIYGMTSEDEGIPHEARNGYYKDGKIHFSVTGYHIPAVRDVMLQLEGEWQKSKYGLQFCVDSFREVLPRTKEGIITYLSSGLIKGIGRSTAELIVQKFGVDALEVIENEPERLLEVKRISKRKLDDIVSAYQQSKSLQDILSFLGPYGITPKKAIKIQDHFGSRSVEVIRHSPFLLCEIAGFGFKTVDGIARKVNFQPADPLRLESGICYVLEEAKDNGDLYLPKTAVIDRALVLLAENVPSGAVSEQMVKDVLSDLCSWGKLIMDGDKIYLSKLHYYEETTAKVIGRMLNRETDTHAELEKCILESQKENRIVLSDKQNEAVKMCMEQPISVITGGPGTGKTTVLKVILGVYQKLYAGKEILLTAPTGRAARKMAESTGYAYASTLHSALGLITDDEEFDQRTELKADFIIVDETSMVDMQLAYYLFDGIGTKTKVLFVGDVDQLPSVGAGNVLKEMIGSCRVPVTVLDTVFRQKDTSRIALNAHSIKNGETKLLYGEDFQFIPVDTAEETAAVIHECYRSQLSVYGIEQVQVLTPFRVKSEAGAMKLNLSLRELVNPCSDKRFEISSGTRSIRYKDKVMQTKNADEVSNGDIGFVTQVDKEDEYPVTVSFSDERIKRYATDELNSIDLAYATTIHKSQGSEYDCVIVPMLSAFYVMLQRALIYTAITRAKKKVILVGQKQALFTAIHRNNTIRRNTALAERINAEVKKQEKRKKTSSKKQEVEQLTL